MTTAQPPLRLLAAAAAAGFLLAACSSAPPRGGQSGAAGVPPSLSSSGATPGASPRGGGYYKDDGPGDHPPVDLDNIADAVPRAEPLHRFANRPYTVFGRDYVPATACASTASAGIASWYGRKFHQQKTSTGEIYDMYAMTAAHPTLPLPSYARVTNVATGKSVVVRVNDRGPFFPGRVIDLSFAAAHRLGIAQRGSGEVEVESLIPAERPVTVALPMAPVASPDAIAQVPVATESGGYAVQLGAFANYANAQAFLAHIANQTPPVNVEARVHQVGGLFRVSVGPYSTREEARGVADRLQVSLGLVATVRAP